MNEILANSSYFGFFITIFIYYICVQIKNKTKNNLLNPLLTATIIIVAILLMFHINYDTYNNGAKYLSYFLTPTTVCLAIPLFKQIKILKKNIIAIISGVLAGVLANAAVIVSLVKIFGLSNQLGTSLLPKSITTPIALGVVEELGGLSSITVFAVILSGIIGAVLAPTIFKILKINQEVSQGLACGTASHGSGTATALELGEIQGAISGLAITVTGIITTIIVPIVNSIFFC